MKCAIIMSSKLGDRWDAGFHITRTEHEPLIEALRKQYPEKEEAETRARRLADSVSTADLQVLAPLTRGTQMQGSPSREKLEGAIREYPHLALAILMKHGRGALEASRTEALQNLNRINASLHELETLEAACTPAAAAETAEDRDAAETASMADIGPIPEELKPLLETHRYVAGVVYDDGDSYVIAVHTSDTCWAADCWMVDKTEWRGLKTLEDLVAEGNVPVPRRFDEIGVPVGFIRDLPGHEQNYGMGWRR